MCPLWSRLRRIALKGALSLCLCGHAFAAGQAPNPDVSPKSLPAKPASHTTRDIEGWTVRVDDRLFSGPDSALGGRALKLLTARLVGITAVMPEKSLAKLREVPIQLDLTHGALRNMQYHPSARWLKDHGYSETLARCVHLPDASYFVSPFENHRQPWAVLHELAHAYHDRVLGFDEPRILAAWKKFRDSGRYKSVLTSPGGQREHYGLTDQKEFFAEMTECYFGANDFYPFVAGELKQAEPEIFALLRDIWGPLPEPAGSTPLRLSSPLDYQVHQRATRAGGKIPVAGTLRRALAEPAVVEARLVGAGAAGNWRQLAAVEPGATEIHAELSAPAGGWYRLEVRVKRQDTVVAETAVEHAGVGEVFVIAGQSNAANHGEEKQRTRSGMVVAFDGRKWRPADDPQPGASGNGGSFVPPFGDALAGRFKVPVGIVATGVGATSVREWLPRGARFPNPPTLTGHVTRLPSGEWESQGTIFSNFTARLKHLGPRGFRAVLWHQGESDANQKDPVCTLPGELYRKFLEQIIRDSRHESGWEAPWFVAQVSYHTPDDTGSPEIRAAQQALWDAGVALAGPDSDALKGDLRENGGKGVHFSGPGLREHAARWVAKVAPWLEQQP